MAKNWSLKEAANEILAGNKEAIVDVGRRFPLTANAIAAMGKNDGALIIIGALPDHISARKIESVLKDGVQEIDDEAEEEVAVEKPAKKEKAAKPVKEDKKPVDKKKTTKKPAMNEPEDDDDEDLESMSEVELYKLCKAKKIKAAPKQDKQYYLDLLQPSEEADEDDDWEDEEEEEKPTKKTTKKTAGKKAKKEDDEEDDWDI